MKNKLSKSVREARALNNVTTNDDAFEDFNPLDVLPEVIDKDFGFFLMFGNPDNPLPGTESTNYDAEISVKGI